MTRDPDPGGGGSEQPVTDLTGPADRTADHEQRRADLGGYVLGNLTVVEQEAVEAHLEACPACRDELAELEVIPVLLDLARPALDPRGRPGTDARGLRRHRVLVGAAATLAVVAALVVSVLAVRSDRPDFGPPIALEPVASLSPAAAATPSGTAALRPTDHGTAVRLDLEGLPTEGTWYECTWSSGRAERSAGTFVPGADGSVKVDLTTAAPVYPGWHLTIVEHHEDGPQGEPVLETSD